MLFVMTSWFSLNYLTYSMFVIGDRAAVYAVECRICVLKQRYTGINIQEAQLSPRNRVTLTLLHRYVLSSFA